MSMKVMSGGEGGASTPIGQRLNHRKRLLRLYMSKNEETRARLLAARGPLKRDQGSGPLV